MREALYGKRMKNKIIGILILTLLIASVFGTILGSATDSNSFTNNKEERIGLDYMGAIPPSDCGKDIDPTLLNNPVVIDGVPAYEWHHGCAPTTVGMIIGYWDAHGYDKLVDGSASYQTSVVNSMIASSGNYYDYCIPIDDRDNIKPDKSEPPIGDEHSDDCVADFSYTSQSYHNNAYGSTKSRDSANGMEGYINWKYPEIHVVTKNMYGISKISWSNYCKEIDADHPVKLSVDSNGDGRNDHAIVGIGYDDTDENHPYYGCYNTWDTKIHWYEWRGVSDTYKWGVYGGTTCFINHRPNKPTIPVGPSSGKTEELHNFSTSTIDSDGDQIWYMWDWGDNTTCYWLGPYNSDEECNASSIWFEKGNYEIKVKAKDIYGAESEWSDPLSISMPKNKPYINSPFLPFLENHPHLFPLLRQLLRL